MAKLRLIILGILASAALLAQAAYAQSECAQFSIYTAESVQAEPGSSVNIDVVVKNTGTCAENTMVMANATGDWKPVLSGSIAPNKSLSESIRITIPADAKTFTVEFMTESTSSFTEIVIGNEETPPAEENQTVPENQTQAEPPVITPTPTIPITTPEAPAGAPAEAPAQTEPQAEQTAGDVTGLVTGNPAAQIAVFALLFFGAGFVAGSLRREGFRYRFRR